MISVIVCSRSVNPDFEFSENVRTTIGVPYELVHIDNSQNTHSILSAYKLGFEQSNFPYLCFVHDDVRFHTADWGLKLKAHLDVEGTGIVGVAGADIVNRIPAAWSHQCEPSQNMLQTDRKKAKTEHLLEPEGYSEAKRTTITVDGVMLCANRSLFENHISFDPMIKGFHGYDYDLSIQATLAGFRNYVIYDILPEHFSRGKTNKGYFENLIYIYKKYETQLPLIGKSVTQNEIAFTEKNESATLKKLIRKMVRKGFSSSEVQDVLFYYANLLGDMSLTHNSYLKILWLRLITRPSHLLKQ